MLRIPGLSNIDNIDPIGASLPKIRFHMNLQVLGSQMALGCEKILNILRVGIEDWGKLRGRHLYDLTWDQSQIRGLRGWCYMVFEVAKFDLEILEPK